MGLRNAPQKHVSERAFVFPSLAGRGGRRRRCGGFGGAAGVHAAPAAKAFHKGRRPAPGPRPLPLLQSPPFVLLHIKKKLPCVPPFEILPNPKTLRLCSATVRLHKKGSHYFFCLSRNVQTRPSMFCSVFYPWSSSCPCSSN